MAEEAKLQVRFRYANEDVADWMERVVQYQISEDHRRRSPLCMRTKMEYLKVPAPENAPFIGGKPVTN